MKREKHDFSLMMSLHLSTLVSFFSRSNSSTPSVGCLTLPTLKRKLEIKMYSMRKPLATTYYTCSKLPPLWVGWEWTTSSSTVYLQMWHKKERKGKEKIIWDSWGFSILSTSQSYVFWLQWTVHCGHSGELGCCQWIRAKPTHCQWMRTTLRYYMRS